MAVLFLTFWGINILFAITTAPFYIPANNAQRLKFLHILTSIGYLGGWFICFNSTILLAINLLILICISNTERFHGLIGHMYIFLGKMSIWVPSPFFNWVFLFFIFELLVLDFFYCSWNWCFTLQPRTHMYKDTHTHICKIILRYIQWHL